MMAFSFARSSGILLETKTSSVGARLPGRGRLITTLGVGFGIAVAIGNTIGAGIVRTPGEIAGLCPRHGSILPRGPRAAST